MGSVGTSKPAYTSEYQYFLDRAYGDRNLAIKDWIGQNVSDTFEKGGKEYTIMWENGVFPRIVSEPSEYDNAIRFEVEVYAVRSDKIDDDEARRKAKLMFIPSYSGWKGRHQFHIQVYER